MRMEGIAGTDSVKSVRLDKSTLALNTIDYVHHETHAGSAFDVTYSVADLGAATTPTDMMTLTFTSPAVKEMHFTFTASGTAGWLVRFIEGSTGGGATPDTSLPIINMHRGSTNTSDVYDVAGTPVINKISPDATLLTGGTTLWAEYLNGTGGPQSGGTATASRNEFILAASTKYQLSLYGTDNDPGTLTMSWYEHTPKIS